jgi:hypothetical protein
MKAHFCTSLLAASLSTTFLVVGCSAETPSSSDDGILAESATSDLSGGRFNHRGDVLIADQYNNRVIELDGARNIVWSFGDGSSTAGPTSIVAPNDAERIGTYTLIAATGAPAGAEPTCTSGCADNRVVIVDRNGKIVWQYGQAGVAGAGANQLNAPVSAVYLPNGHVLIADQGNQRVIEVNSQKNIVWQYGQTGVAGAADGQLNNVNSAELLACGDILIADEGNNRVLQVSREKKIIWSYGSPSDTTTLNGAAFASRLDDGDTLISDANNNRVVEVDPSGTVVWSFVTSARTGSVAAPNPTRAIRLRNGNTLISDQNNHQVITVNHAGVIVDAIGTIGVAGATKGELNGPYDAKVIGDYTGITSPSARY